MNFLKTFESRVSHIFGEVRSPFSLKKLAKQAAHEMEDQTLVINGVNTAPALYTVLIAAEDDTLMAPYYPQLAREIADLIKAQAEKRRYTFVGEPLVRFMIDPSLKAGKFSVFAENVDTPTLGRLYEEERAFQKGLAQGSAPDMQHAEMPSRALHAVNRRISAIPSPLSDIDEPNPFGSASADALQGAVSVPQTMTREQLAGLGGAAAAGGIAGAGAAGALAAGDSNSAPRQPQAQLVDVVTGASHPIVSSPCVIGREGASADVVLRDPNVSRRHAELTFTGSAWSIEDLNSTNGTLVNNRRITRCPLRGGDMLTFGLSTFEFRG